MQEQLTADEARAEVVKLRAQLADARAQLAGIKNEDVLREAAQLAGYKFSVLKDRAAGLAVEIRDVRDGGAVVKRPFVKDGERWRPIEEYAADHWADYLPALVDPEAQRPAGYQAPREGGVNFLKRKYGRAARA